MAETQVSSGLAGVTVAIPETRQQDLLASMLRARGARVLEVPLVAIHDHPDEAAVLAWLRAFIAAPPDLLILLTGEGLRRLLELAGRKGIRDDFIAVLARVRKLTRGPKPERVLRELSLAADIQALAPTSEGIIETLGGHHLEGSKVSVQLYGEDPNLRLTGFLESKGARVDTVAPYVYASQEEEGLVVRFIRQLAAGEIDVLAFTSQAQYKRLAGVAKANALLAELERGMRGTALAAVGPVVRDQLREAGYKVAIMPERVYFMKPLVRAIETWRHNESEA